MHHVSREELENTISSDHAPRITEQSEAIEKQLTHLHNRLSECVNDLGGRLSSLGVWHTASAESGTKADREPSQYERIQELGQRISVNLDLLAELVDRV